MKKGIVVLLAVIVISVGAIEIALTMQKPNNNTETKTEQKQEDVYSFKYEEKEIKLAEEFSKDKFGEEEAYSEIASCAFEGLDKTYTYKDYEITTFPKDNKDYIYSIYLLNEEVGTSEGVKVSDNKDKMISVYGEEYTQMGNQYTYTKGKTNIEFIVENDVITSIQYTYTAE